MLKVLTRNPRLDEVPALREMWRTVFGAEGLDSFFRLLFSPEHTVIAEVNGRLAAMGYLVPAGELLLQTVQLPCVMLYAIAAAPEYRGRGLGAAVTDSLLESASQQGFEAAVLSPAQDSLFNYYGRHTDMREWFYTDETGISTMSVTAEQKPGGTNTSSMTAETMPADYVRADAAGSITPDIPRLKNCSTREYYVIRERLLERITHVKHSLPCLEYQHVLCKDSGGGFYKIGNSCAAVETGPRGAVLVKELLFSKNDDRKNITAAIIKAFPSHEYIFRSPAAADNNRRHGMIAAFDKDSQELLTGELNKLQAQNSTLPWYGFAFD